MEVLVDWEALGGISVDGRVARGSGAAGAPFRVVGLWLFCLLRRLLLDGGRALGFILKRGLQQVGQLRKTQGGAKMSSRSGTASAGGASSAAETAAALLFLGIIAKCR